MIPNRLIITYISKAALNPMMRHCVQRMEELQPDWDIQFFSDGDCVDFVRAQGQGFLDLYQWYPRPVQKADLFRVLAVWALGGFYLDADVLLSRPLDPLCRHRAVFPWEWEMGRPEFEVRFPKADRSGEKPVAVGQYAFGPEAKHPFLEDQLREMTQRSANIMEGQCTDLDVLYSTGPDVTTSCYYRKRQTWKENVTVLWGAADTKAGEAPLFGKDRWQRFGAYGRHLLNSGWHTEK